jgi:hypothetical protein
MPVKNNAMPDLITQIYPWKIQTIDSWKKVITKPHFRNTSPNVSLVDLFIIFLQESLFYRAYLKFRDEGFAGGLISVKRKFREKSIFKR